MKRSLTVLAAFALGAGVVVAAAATYYLLPAPAGDLASAPDETEYPISLIDFADQRVLALAPVFSDEVELRTTATGVVTWSACTGGKELVAGEPAFRVDGAPVLSLPADMPFYRNLGWGDEGTDVDSLRRALVALGYGVADSGAFGDDVHDALSEIQERHGLTPRDGAFHLTDFIWLPTGSPTIATCDVKVGQTYLAGEIFATTATALTSLSVISDSNQAILPGERAIEVFGVDTTIPESGVISDPQVLSQIAASPDGKAEIAGVRAGTSAVISGTSELADHLRVAPIPAASVFGVRGSQGCVASEDGTHQITIVGASLGMSLVTFDGDPPKQVLLQPEQDSCSAE